MNNLYILGAGGFGREVAAFLPDLPGWERDWRFKGFLDSRSGWGNVHADYPILGNEDEYPLNPDDWLILAVADGALKEKLAKKLAGKVQFFTCIHPSVSYWSRLQPGEGTVIYPNCVISVDVKIGSFVTINSGSLIGHDCSIGDYSSLMAHVDLGGGVQLGTHVYLGTKAVVVPQKNIADHVKIAVGSIVMRSCKARGCTLMGNPATKME